MSGYLDGASLDIPCPRCGKKTAKTFGWLKANRQMACSCGARIELDSDQLRRELAALENGLDGLRDVARRLGK